MTGTVRQTVADRARCSAYSDDMCRMHAIRTSCSVFLVGDRAFRGCKTNVESVLLTMSCELRPV